MVVTDTNMLCLLLAPIFISTSPQNLKVSQGNSVSFNCSASGPSNLTITWKASGTPITTPDGNVTIATLDLGDDGGSITSTLTILSTGLQHQGNYSCVASNQFGSDEKTVLTLVVVGKAQSHDKGGCRLY